MARSVLADYIEFTRDHWKMMVKKYLIENAHVEPSLTLRLTDNRIAFSLRFVVDYKKWRITKDRLYKGIARAIEETGGKVALASATFEITAAPDIPVTLRDQKR